MTLLIVGCSGVQYI